MCGIIAYLGSAAAFDYIVSSLGLLQNRGYDSAGICTLDTDGKLIVDKYASRTDKNGVELLEEKKSFHIGHRIGIGHTRWATHGAKTDTNAHPHLDTDGMFAVVHNGIIENYLEIKTKLIAEGYVFLSETDTEVVPKLLEYNWKKELERCNGNEKVVDFEKNVLDVTIQSLEGTWAIIVMFAKTPDTLYLCKNGSPLVLSINNDFTLIASEQLPLSRYFTNFITLNDGDVVTIHKDLSGRIVFNNKPHYKEHIIQNKATELSPYPYSHWTIKEIYEQPMSFMRALNMGGRLVGGDKVKLGGLDSNREQILAIDNLILLGCGTSYNAGNIGMKMLQQFKCVNHVMCIDASEFSEADVPARGKTGFVLLSQSGETKDLHRCVEVIRRMDSPIISIVNVVGSLIARESDCGIYLNAGREVGVASTKSFTSQIVSLALLTLWFSQNKNTFQNLRSHYIQGLRSLSLDIEKLLANLGDSIRRLAHKFVNTQHMFLLGRGVMKYICDEGSLKIKEIAYIHAEGYAGGALKHGPFALIDKDTVVILIAPRNENFSKMLNAAEEVYARHAKILLITNAVDTYEFNTKIYEDILTIPANDHFQSVLSIIPIQMLSYEISLLKGCNPDFPRNLAKVVTVDG